MLFRTSALALILLSALVVAARLALPTSFNASNSNTVNLPVLATEPVVMVVPTKNVAELQDSTLTPGAVVSTNVNLVCSLGYASSIRPRGALWRTLKAEAYAGYHIPAAQRATVDGAGVHHSFYQVDHLIPLELGGDPTSIENIWPQRIESAERKDRVEDKLHELVCSGQMSIGVAQQRIRENWKTAVND